MRLVRSLLAASVLCLLSSAGPIGCASIMKGSRAQVTLLKAPPDLVVLDESGAQVRLTDEGNGTKIAEIPWKTSKVTLQTGGVATQVELDSLLGFGYFIADYLLFVFPLIVDFATGKWMSYEDVVVPKALADAQAKGRGGQRVASSGPPAEQQRQQQKAAEAQRQAEQQRQLEQQRQQEQQRAQAARPVISEAVSNNSGPSRPARGQTLVTKGKLAVLDFKSYTDALKPEDVRYFTDVVRGSALRSAPGLSVMTRENLLVLLQATGKDAGQCEGECEVDTGRRIGADAVVSGEILKVGSKFKMSLKLHETAGGQLLSTAVASGKSIDELDESAQAAAADLLAPPAR
jgi:hypothetical protein